MHIKLSLSQPGAHLRHSRAIACLRLVVLACLIALADVPHAGSAAGAPPPVAAPEACCEAAFPLPSLTGNPFDFLTNDIRVEVKLPNGAILVTPAFYDGADTWRVRFHAATVGDYAIRRVLRNGIAISPPPVAEPARFHVAAATGHGYVRVDSIHPTRFRFDDGTVYYPIGIDAAWGKGGDDAYLLGVMDHMAARGGANWTRIWMNHWDGKNLDWETGKRGEFDRLDLDAARRWDRIVQTAEKDGLYVQMTLQHHGPYSSRVNSNWPDNPWNRKNGGFLETPSDFFTDPRAIALTKAKFRYIVARWGYSPNILAWELFNEVQWCDPIYDKKPAVVAKWHREMAAFLRAQDPNRHLITTSSDTQIPGLYDAMDYVQPHAYPSDVVAVLTAYDPVYAGKPYFFGEFGPANRTTTAQDNSVFHNGVWASLMSRSAGAAQFWYWDAVDDHDLYPTLRAAADFVRAVGPAVLTDLRPVKAQTRTPNAAGAVTLGPGREWGQARRTRFTVDQSGAADGIGEMPSFLQGNNHRDMFPFAEFDVDFGSRDGTLAVSVRQVSRAGGHLTIAVDGRPAAAQDFPASEGDHAVQAVVSAAIPAGRHVIRLENTGTDWVVIGSLTLSPYGPALRTLAKADARHAVLWVTNGVGTPAAGEITLPGMRPGVYRVIWRDTETGRDVRRDTLTVPAGAKDLRLATPPIARDIAAFVTPGAG